MARIEGESLAQFRANRFVRRENPRGFANYFSASNTVARHAPLHRAPLMTAPCVVAAFAIE
jgi:hypothetical protein